MHSQGFFRHRPAKSATGKPFLQRIRATVTAHGSHNQHQWNSQFNNGGESAFLDRRMNAAEITLYKFRSSSRTLKEIKLDRADRENCRHPRKVPSVFDRGSVLGTLVLWSSWKNVEVSFEEGRIERSAPGSVSGEARAGLERGISAKCKRRRWNLLLKDCNKMVLLFSGLWINLAMEVALTAEEYLMDASKATKEDFETGVECNFIGNENGSYKSYHICWCPRNLCEKHTHTLRIFGSCKHRLIWQRKKFVDLLLSLDESKQLEVHLRGEALAQI
nr:ATP-dependent RNA helicase DEAH11, chloroplastic-like [Ipomoea batatas]